MIMDTQTPGPSGLLGSLRGFADGLVGTVQDRIELLSVELQEEKHRLIQISIWISAIVMLAMLAFIFASVAVLIVFWDNARVTVAITLASAYALGLIGVVLGFRAYLARQPKPFAATLGEIKEDRACIQPET